MKVVLFSVAFWVAGNLIFNSKVPAVKVNSAPQCPQSQVMKNLSYPSHPPNASPSQSKKSHPCIMYATLDVSVQKVINTLRLQSASNIEASRPIWVLSCWRTCWCLKPVGPPMFLDVWCVIDARVRIVLFNCEGPTQGCWTTFNLKEMSEKFSVSCTPLQISDVA